MVGKLVGKSVGVSLVVRKLKGSSFRSARRDGTAAVGGGSQMGCVLSTGWQVFV